jgi:SAM-dependent methyltransferase
VGALRTRDTDADWRRIGETEPFWGVLSGPQFRSDAIDDAAVEAFYGSGHAHVAALAEDFRRFLGLELRVDRALDFGCGVGRLSEAMTARAQAVTGHDISNGMLDVARSRSSAVRYLDTLPDEPFDWINSYIVFQHIAPERGLEALDALLARLAPGGLLSLHFTVWREAALHVPPPSLAARLRGFEPPVGEIQMYDYDLNAVVQRLHLAGVRQMALDATDHAGHHGVMIFARRADPPEPPRY